MATTEGRRSVYLVACHHILQSIRTHRKRSTEIKTCGAAQDLHHFMAQRQIVRIWMTRLTVCPTSQLDLELYRIVIAPSQTADDWESRSSRLWIEIHLTAAFVRISTENKSRKQNEAAIRDKKKIYVATKPREKDKTRSRTENWLKRSTDYSQISKPLDLKKDRWTVSWHPGIVGDRRSLFFKRKPLKVPALIGIISSSMSPIGCVFENGTGPNLIGLVVLDQGSLHITHQRDMPKDRSASGTKLVVHGTNALHPRLVQSHTRVTLGVVNTLAVPVLMETTCIIKFVKLIHLVEGKIFFITPRPYQFRWDMRQRVKARGTCRTFIKLMIETWHC